MKRRKLLKKLKDKGWYLYRHGSRHDVYTDGIHFEPIPRHSDIDEDLARAIIRKYRLWWRYMMKYPIVMQKGKDFYVPYVPDFDIRTQGRTEDEAVNMAVDAVCMVGLCYRENGMRLPEPTPLEEIEVEDGESTMLVEIDLETYQRRCEEERGQLAG